MSYFGTLQEPFSVVKRDKVGDASFGSRFSAYRASLEIKGTAIPTDREHGYEIQVTEAKVVGPVDPSNFPITESAMEEADGGETEFLLDNRHLPEDR